jgi:type III secretion protein V
LLGRIRLQSDLGVVAVLVATILLMIVPLPTPLVDLLLAFNLSISVLLLMVAIYLQSPVQFSTLPAVILIATVFRLSLSIAVTRLILLQADAGAIISTFGDFVVSGSIAVGLVIFLIITIVQFIVITKGAERIAEVAARFTLDALPGKQMAIDADVRAGELDQHAARMRRRDLERESQLYGAMDGAMKFVKGDAIAGLVIICVNLIGGLAVGTLQNGMSLAEAAHTYSILTVGDGLMAQIPALFVSITAGAVVTRVSGGEADSLGAEITQQLGKNPRALWLAAVIAALLGCIPGFPTLIFLATAGGIGLMAHRAGRRQRAAAEAKPARSAPPALPARVQLHLDAPLAAQLGAERLTMSIARHSATLGKELGVPVPSAEVISTASSDGLMRLELDGVPIAEAEIPPDRLLLRDDAENAELAGAVVEPGRPLPGRDVTLWVPSSQRQVLVSNGIGFLDPVDALAQCVPAALRRHASRLMGVQETRQLLTGAEAHWGELVREALRVAPVQRLADLFRRLLDEGLTLRNLRGVLESVLEHGAREQDPVMLAEAVRAGMRRQICHAYADPLRVIGAFIVDAGAEAVLRSAVQQAGNSAHLPLAEGTATMLVERVRAEVTGARGPGPVVLTAMDVRRHLRALLHNNGIHTPVLSFHDLLPEFTVQPLGTIRLSDAPGAAVVQTSPARTVEAMAAA